MRCIVDDCVCCCCCHIVNRAMSYDFEESLTHYAEMSMHFESVRCCDPHALMLKFHPYRINRNQATS